MASPTMGSPAMFGGFKHPGMAPALTPNELAPAPAATPPVTPESGGEDPKVWACAETLVRAVFDLQHADAQAQPMLVALGGPEGSSSVYIRAFKLLKEAWMFSLLHPLWYSLCLWVRLIRERPPVA